MIVQVNNTDIDFDFQADTAIPEDLISLQKEACKTPNIIAKYGEILAELKADTERKKFNLDETSAFVADEIRKTSTEKLTVDRIKELVLLDGRVKGIKNTYIDALRNMHAIDNIMRALYKKADIVTTLLYQYRQEMKSYSGNGPF